MAVAVVSVAVAVVVIVDIVVVVVIVAAGAAGRRHRSRPRRSPVACRLRRLRRLRLRHRTPGGACFGRSGAFEPSRCSEGAPGPSGGQSPPSNVGRGPFSPEMMPAGQIVGVAKPVAGTG